LEEPLSEATRAAVLAREDVPPEFLLELLLFIFAELRDLLCGLVLVFFFFRSVFLRAWRRGGGAGRSVPIGAPRGRAMSAVSPSVMTAVAKAVPVASAGWASLGGRSIGCWCWVFGTHESEVVADISEGR
jgi:hypothetical protein